MWRSVVSAIGAKGECMKILVTGAAGFIGFHACLRLRDKGHAVVAIDNLNDYYMVSLKEGRVEKLMERGGIHFERLDLADRDNLNRLFREQAPDLVLHLAAQAGVRYSLENPHAYIDSNIVGTTNVLEGCRHHGKPRLVYASSSSVYGGLTELPFSESNRVDTPISLYAATKKANELMAHTYTHLYGMQTVGLRFFTVYGPWGRPDMAMWLFCDAIQSGKPIKVFNHGDMFRDFTYIDDILQGIEGSLFADSLDPYEIFNLGNHRSEKLMDMIALIEHHMGKTSEKIMLPMQPGDVKSTYADIELARKKLGFSPETSIEEGVPRFVAWFKQHPQFHGGQ
jgi:UDP-glucuronate 4-epimerase